MSQVVAEIETPASATATPFAYDAFVIHAVADESFVQGFLLPQLGLAPDRCLLPSTLELGQFVIGEIERGVRSSRVTIVVLSQAYMADHWAVFGEQIAAYASVVEDSRALVPLLLEDCDLPDHIAALVKLDFRDSARASWQTEADRLCKHLARPGRPRPPEPIDCPYPGMRPFSAEATSRFHGRASEIDELLGRLRAGEREIYVIGPSGSGKSSLIAAGLLPRLRAAGQLAGHRFATRGLRPGDQPVQRLTEALACDPESLDEAVDRLLTDGSDRLLLFIDQLEELFALAVAEERDRFVRALRVLRADPRCHFLFALRADFYGALMSSALWPDISHRFTRLEIAPLLGDALREAIEVPARQCGVYLERGLVDRLVVDAAAEPGALPLLQEALVLLWNHRSHRLLRLASYDGLGSDGRSGLAVALARRADAVFHDLTPEQQRLVRRIFLRLVSFGDGRPDTRRQQPRAALAASGNQTKDVELIIDRLIDERMLTSDANTKGEPLVDLAHEALIAGWPEFQRWLLARRDDEQRRRLLELRVSEWAKRGHGSVGLFDPVELSEAERWITSETAHELGYSDDLPRFLAASRAAIDEGERQQRLTRDERERERRAAQDERLRLRRRLTRSAVVALALFSITASMLGLIAWRERNATRLQLGRNERELARSLLVDSLDASDAIPHLERAVSLGADDSVLRVLLAEARYGTWRIAFRHGKTVHTAAFSPDGSRILTQSTEGTRIWDAVTGSPITGLLQHKDTVFSAAFSPDGSRIVTAGGDGIAWVWDAATGTRVAGPLQHAKYVASAAFSPDGARVVTASYDGTARIWDAVTGAPIAELLHHAKGVSHAAFSPDGSRILTAGHDFAARIWDAATGAPIAGPLQHASTINSAAFSPDGSRIVTASDDGSARIWDAVTGAGLVTLVDQGSSSKVTSAAFSPDGTRVVITSGHTAQVRDAATGSPTTSLLKHSLIVDSAAFSPDGTRVVTASWDGSARVWDAATGSPLSTPLKHSLGVASAAFSPDGSRVVTASWDGTARIWDSDTGVPCADPLKHASAVTGVAFSADGSRVVTAGDNSTAYVWDATTGARVAGPSVHTEAATSAAFSPDGWRAVVASYDGPTGGAATSRDWDISTRLLMSGPFLHSPFRAAKGVARAAFSPDGSRVIPAGHDGTLHIWSTATGAPVDGPLAHAKGITSVAFSRDGSRIVTASSDGATQVWDAATGVLLAGALKHTGRVLDAAFHRGGTLAVLAGEGRGVRIWDAATGSVIAGPLRHDGDIDGAVFSPDGSRVVTASIDRTARVWSAATGSPVTGPLQHGAAVSSVAFSPDGSRVITASLDGTARVWDATTGSPVTGPLKHDIGVSRAAFSPDGSYAVTTSWDLTARIWDTATGFLLTPPRKHDGPVDSAAFSPDGSRVVTISWDDAARIWSLLETGPLATWVEQARRCVVPTTISAAICPLHDRRTTPWQYLASARSLMLTGDVAGLSRIAPLSRAGYQRAIAVLDDHRDAIARAYRADADILHQAILARIAVLDAAEGHLREARAQLGAKAPASDIDLLNQLAGFVHDELKNGGIATQLLVQARDLDSQQARTVCNLAELYFAIGQYDDFARTARDLAALSATAEQRVVVATLAWAIARMTQGPEDAQRAHVLEAYGQLANGAQISWTWRGTKHALAYGHVGYRATRPIINVLELLDQPVTDDTRARLVDLLQVDGQNPTGP